MSVSDGFCTGDITIDPADTVGLDGVLVMIDDCDCLHGFMSCSAVD